MEVVKEGDTDKVEINAIWRLANCWLQVEYNASHEKKGGYPTKAG